MYKWQLLVTVSMSDFMYAFRLVRVLIDEGRMLIVHKFYMVAFFFFLC